MMRLTRLSAIALLAIISAACGRHAPEAVSVDYQKEIQDWRALRLGRVAGPDGWATLAGLYWLKQGENRFGSGAGNELVLAEGGLPAFAGSFTLAKGAVSFNAAPGAGILSGGKPVTTLALVTDLNGDPTVLNRGSLSFYAIERSGGRYGVRVKDTAADARVHFKGLQYFPLDPAWRFEARFEAYPPGRKVSIVDVFGVPEEMDSPGALVFALAGKDYRLDTVLETGETDYFVMFGDKTNGKDTYGAGRFMYVKPPVNGKTVLDFNKSYNPPCVFSVYATCPLPPPQNKLPLAITAGELKYDGAGH
jgi:uncharacterized protein (DUF1684 family)